MVEATDRFIGALGDGELDESAMLDMCNLKIPKVGEVVTGTVTSVMEYGAFVELDGIGWCGLIHISEIQEEYVDCVGDYLQPGQPVRCVVIRARGERSDRKLSLSMKRLQDPAARVAYENGAGIMADQIEQARAANAEDGDGSHLPQTSNQVSDVIRRMESRIEAMEGVLIQLGHGEALRNAQADAKHSVDTRTNVPPIDVMLAGLPPEGIEPTQKLSKKDSERMAIDQILADLTGESDNPPSIEEIDEAIAREEVAFNRPLNGRKEAPTSASIEDPDFGVDPFQEALADTLVPGRRKK